jgi:glycosyltransferase involved in cell wall biosynthesis
MDPHPLITVITATTVRPDRMAWLAGAHASLHRNAMPWEHVIVVDGGDPGRLPLIVTACERTTVVTLPDPMGAAAARNIGLHRAAGRYVTSVDDDDLLTPHSLDVRAAVLEAGTAWVAGQLAHLHADGIVTPWPAPAGDGPVTAGAVMAAWPDPAATVPLGPTTVMTTAARMRAAGGWAGLPTGEDLSLLAAVTGAEDGMILPTVVYLYRSHPGQSLKTSPSQRWETTAREIAFQRAAALARN